MRKIDKTSIVTIPKNLVDDLRQLIASTRQQIAQTVNSSLVILYWNIGGRIKTEILKKKRAEYGEEIVATVSAQLVFEYGQGFNEKNIWRMLQFVENFPEEEIVVTLSRDLGWSHFVAILPVKDPLARMGWL